jgi:hypothetical protein
MLASGDVSVNTGSGTLAQQVSDIIVAAGFSWTSSSALTLDAYHSVTVQGAVADNGSGATSLITNDGGSGGTLSFVLKGSLSFLTTSNALSINGQIYTLASDVSTLASDIAANPSGAYALSASYDASKDGTYTASPISTEFLGSFNGLGNTVSDISVRDHRGKGNVGLFATVGASGVVSSLHLLKVAIWSGQNSYVGGLTGLNYGTLFGSSVEGSVVTKGGKGGGASAGGIAGVNGGVIISSASTANISVKTNSQAASASIGGLVGINNGGVYLSFSTGKGMISGPATGASAGGLVGVNTSIIQNCYAEGPATVGSSGQVGGLVGVNGVSISSAYSTGAVSGSGGAVVGGSIGYDGSSEDGGTVSNDYWDTKSSGIKNLSQGAGNIANDPGITGQTTADLKSSLPAGFDPGIWAEEKKVNSGLPYLIANPPVN